MAAMERRRPMGEGPGRKSLAHSCFLQSLVVIPTLDRMPVSKPDTGTGQTEIDFYSHMTFLPVMQDQGPHTGDRPQSETITNTTNAQRNQGHQVFLTLKGTTKAP